MKPKDENIEFVDYSWIDNFISQDLTEKQVIELLLHAFSPEKGTPDLNIFSNVLYGPFYIEHWKKFTGCYLLTNRLITEFGLKIFTKPGDIDILIIPYDESMIYYENTAVFEVKVVRPTRKNIKRGANSDGYNQVMGLVKTGFPLVGLIHVILAEPLSDEEKVPIKFMKRPANAEETGARNLPGLDEFEIIKHDWLPMFSENTQMKRMLSYDIPKYVGLKTLGMHFSADGNFRLGYSYDFHCYETGFFNPHRKTETVNAVKEHHQTFLQEYKRVKLR